MITILKLTSGAEVIGNLQSANSEGFSLKDPLLIYYRHRLDSPMPSAGLTRYSPFSQQEHVMFKHEHVMNTLEPVPSMLGYYEVALKTMIRAMDKNVDAELSSVTSEFNNEQLPDDSEAKLALLERIASKARLN